MNKYKDLYEFKIGERFYEPPHKEIFEVIDIKHTDKCCVVYTKCIDDGSINEWWYATLAAAYAPRLIPIIANI
jgi:replicative DNA helicase